MFFRISLLSALFYSSVGYAVTESDILNAQSQFNENILNVEFVKKHMDAVANDSGLPPVGGSTDNGNGSTGPWYGEPEAWNDLVVALKTLDVVSNNVQATIPGLLPLIFNFPVFTIRHTALCSQLTQVNTAWTSLEFADFTTLPFNQRLGSKFYQDARAVVALTRGPAGLQCP